MWPNGESGLLQVEKHSLETDLGIQPRDFRILDVQASRQQVGTTGQTTVPFLTTWLLFECGLEICRLLVTVSRFSLTSSRGKDGKPPFFTAPLTFTYTHAKNFLTSPRRPFLPCHVASASLCIWLTSDASSPRGESAPRRCRLADKAYSALSPPSFQAVL
jgi:hypothetical protein